MPTVTPLQLMDKLSERIQELEPAIQKLARRWSRDCPEDWEDLAQEAWMAIYLELVETPDRPNDYLFRVAQHEIQDYRRRGKSIDGKLHRSFNRSTVWVLVSLDTGPDVVPAEYSGLYFKPHQLRPVEDLALAKVAYDELVRRLTGQQAQYLSLLLQGYSCRQVDALMGVKPWRGDRLRKEIQRQARDVLQPSPAPIGRGRGRR